MSTARAIAFNKEAERKHVGWYAVPRVMLSLYFLTWLVFLIFWVAPETVRDVVIRGIYLPFLAVVFGLVFSLMWWWRNSKMKAFVWSVAGVGFLLLRLLGLGHILNALLLSALLLSLEYYWRAEDEHAVNRT
jgi:hypothetical protein